MAKKGSSKHKKDTYARYKTSNTQSKNKVLKIKRHMKNHPNDLQSNTDNIKYCRKTPKSKVWTSGKKHTAHLIKWFNGRFTPAMLSSEFATVKKAFQVHERTVRTKNTAIPFTLGDRAHYRFQ